MTTYEHLCISSCLGSDRLSANTRGRTPGDPGVAGAGRYLSVRLCPSKAASSLSPTPLPPFICLPSSDSSVQFPRSPFAWSPVLSLLPPLPSPSLPFPWLSLTHLVATPAFVFSKWKIVTCCFARTRILQKHCARSSKIYNLPAFFSPRPLISLAGPSSCAPSMRATRATLSWRSAGPES